MTHYLEKHLEGETLEFWSVNAPTKDTTTGIWLVICRWGRLGEPVRASARQFKDEWKADAFIQRKLRSKRHQGYFEVSAPTANFDAAAEAAPKVPRSERKKAKLYETTPAAASLEDDGRLFRPKK